MNIDSFFIAIKNKYLTQIPYNAILLNMIFNINNKNI